jgi:hypothetical protein
VPDVSLAGLSTPLRRSATSLRPRLPRFGRPLGRHTAPLGERPPRVRPPGATSPARPSIANCGEVKVKVAKKCLYNRHALSATRAPRDRGAR